MERKIKFKATASLFHSDLKTETQSLLTADVIRNADFIIKFKFSLYSILFLLFYANLYNPYLIDHNILFIFNYIAIGLSGILLAFNCSHDCVHHTFSKNRKVNRIIFYITFNLQGVNASLWRKRHIASHHVFPNVDGCDADIDNNPFIRLSKSHPYRSIYRYQHLYASLLYGLYTLHWIFIKDFIYLNKKRLANLIHQTYSPSFILEVIALKLFYLTYMLLMPIAFTDITFEMALIAFLIMHVFISIFFVLTLVISHLNSETAFPKIDEDGYLPFDYYGHQLAVSLDYHPTSRVANWIFGGFNSHTAHHLFPHLPHTVYTTVSPAIKKIALKHNLPYHEKSIPEAIASHYRYLQLLGKAF